MSTPTGAEVDPEAERPTRRNAKVSEIKRLSQPPGLKERRNEEHWAGRTSERGDLVGCTRHQMLGIVEEEQCLLAPQGGHKRLGQRRARALPELEHLRDRGQDRRRVAQGRKRNPPNAVGEAVGGLRGRLQGEPRLARPTRAGKREQPHVVSGH